MSQLANKFMPKTTPPKEPINENQPQRRGAVLALEIELDDGTSDIIPYSWLRRIRFAADRQSLEVHFTETSYRITGIKLRSLADSLKQQNIDLLRASEASMDPSPNNKNTPYITSVSELNLSSHHPESSSDSIYKVS